MSKRTAAICFTLAILLVGALAIARGLAAQEITTCQGAGCYGGGQSCDLEYKDAHGNTIFMPCPAGRP